MKRVMLAVMSGLLLSCQGPAAVLAHEARPAAVGLSATIMGPGPSEGCPVITERLPDIRGATGRTALLRTLGVPSVGR